MKKVEIYRFPPLLIARTAAIVGMMALLILTASLPYFDFQPGQALAVPDKEHVFAPIRVRFNFTFLSSICLAGIVVMMPAAVALLIFSSEARRLFRKYAKVLLIWLVFLLALRFYIMVAGEGGMVYETSKAPARLSDGFDPPSGVGIESELGETYTPPAANGWLGYLVGFATLVIILVVGYLWWDKKHSKEEDLEHITLRAIREISAGRQWEDAVIECYAHMNASVSRQRNLDRQGAMTPAEFSQVLVANGLPIEPVTKLTHLFEQARYGTRVSEKSEARDAIRCLSTINQALGGDT